MHVDGVPGIGDQLYRLVVEASGDLIWAVDLEGRFSFVNRAASSAA